MGQPHETPVATPGADIEKRRERILDVADRLFSEQPYDLVSVEDLSRVAGVSAGLLYYYFGSKRGLFTEVVRHQCTRLREHLRPDPAIPPAMQAREGLRRYLEYVEQQGPGFVALLRGGVGADPEVFAIVDELRRETARWVAVGAHLDPDDPTVRALLAGWPTYVENAAISWHEDPLVDREAMIDALYDVLEAAVTAARSHAGVGLVPTLGEHDVRSS